jgi:long-chain fatty acid transport protein
VIKSLVALSVAFAFSFHQDAQAAAFALHEQGVSGLGNAYAGAAAAAEDASTVWWNPAGMARLPRGSHFLAAGHFISPSTKFTDSGSVPAAASNPARVGSGGDAGKDAFVPNLFYATDVDSTWSFGFGLSAPFGLKTEYEADWVGRFQGLTSEVKTLNFNPAVSYKINERAAVGVGASWQRAEIDLITAVNYSGIAFGAGGSGLLSLIGGPGLEGRNTTSLEGDAWGWNVGGLYDVTRALRVGAHYRSSIRYKTKGTTSFTGAPPLFAAIPALAAATSDGDVRLELETPSSLSVSAAHRASDRVEFLADVTWTEWSKIGQLPIMRTNGPANDQALDTLVFNFDDAWRVGVGANYRWGPVTLRAGAAYDQSPVPGATDRSVRLPDNDRYWLSLGATWLPNALNRLDVGYAFIQIKDAEINSDQAARGRGIVRGTYEADVHIFSVQYQFTF